ncbi:Ni/Fe hydrogenase [Orenia metallireducens]|uniref:Ni/Fe hydrogenase n=1 Tax=Orenia metallireducens TaxID=1413210 RepID=A0A1C0A8I6_9FIRM|nr:hydrogenase small subunit [Orenia metallireducens]OCL26547.1 Ni/Fe hydrogenase [Orenia metallireducens]
MRREQFVKECYRLRDNQDYGLSQHILSSVKGYRAKDNDKLPVLWLETSDSGDNNISFMNTSYPYLGQVFDEMIDLLYSNTFMAAQGRDAVDILNRVARYQKGEFTLVVEGAIPTKANGLYNIVIETEREKITALEVVKWLGGLAKYVVTIGTCASFGGPSAAKPNITGGVAVSEVLDREIIKVSGCPVNAEWFVGTLAHLLMYGQPEVDELGRPTLFYGYTIHRHCQRRSYFDRGNFAESLGDIECMFSQGCVGPKTYADCPYRQWINESWPIEANTPCIGCTNPDFPDGSTPFFTPLPEKRNEELGKRGQRGGEGE